MNTCCSLLELRHFVNFLTHIVVLLPSAFVFSLGESNNKCLLFKCSTFRIQYLLDWLYWFLNSIFMFCYGVLRCIVSFRLFIGFWCSNIFAKCSLLHLQLFIYDIYIKCGDVLTSAGMLECWLVLPSSEWICASIESHQLVLALKEFFVFLALYITDMVYTNPRIFLNFILSLKYCRMFLYLPRCSGMFSKLIFIYKVHKCRIIKFVSRFLFCVIEIQL